MDLKRLEQTMKGSVAAGHLMAPETTFRIGGPAAALAEPEDEADLMALLRWAREGDVRLLFLGGGSNVLFADGGFDGVVVRPGPGLRAVRTEGNLIRCGAGAPLAAVVHKAAESGLGGLEFCAGVPGTVGGAVIGNAGGKDAWIGERVAELTVASPDGTVKTLLRGDVQWGYRMSSLKGAGLFLLRVVLSLPATTPDEARRKAQEYWDSRRTRQPLGKRNAGSTFKNPPGEFAGALLEKAGMKGFSVGGARVSDVHANFINNEAGATARDVVAVMREGQRRVMESRGIRLEPEILPLGDWDRAEAADVWWNLPDRWFR